MKTNRSYAKRLKVTKTGKVLKRKSGHNHFNAKEDRSSQLGKKGFTPFIISKKKLARYLPYTN